jgi:phage tail sheath gpL-like
MPIGFQQIPSTVGVPGTYIEFDPTGARTTQAGKPYKLMVYGPMSAAKSVTNLTGSTAQPNMPVQVQSAAQAAALFGASSILAHMAKTLFKTNSQTEAWFCPQLDDAAGTARVLTVDYAAAYTTAAAAPFAPGIERLYVGEDEYRVGVAVGTTAAQVATAMATAINGDAARLFEAAAAGAVLTLTAQNKGECSNDVQVVAQYNVGDVGASGAFASVVQTTAGAGNPSIAAGIASASTMYITHVILPYNDATNYALLLAEAQDRWSPLPGASSVGNGQDDFVVFCAYRGTEAQFSTFMAAGRNSEYFTVAHIEPPSVINNIQYGGLMSSAWQYAAAYGALSSQLARVVCNNPLQNRVLNCLKPAPVAARFAWNIRNRTILNYGGATYKYNDAGQVVLEAAITEKLTTDSGALTDAERRVETQLQKSYLRWSLRMWLDERYPYSRLANNGTAGLPNNVVTPDIIKGSILSLCKTVWVASGVVENFDQFKAGLVVERSLEDCNTIKFQIFPDLVNILTVKAGKISYIVC